MFRKRQRPNEENEMSYCYRLQAWIIDGKVSGCGHPEIKAGHWTFSPPCYSCNHEGEIHPADCPDCR